MAEQDDKVYFESDGEFYGVPIDQAGEFVDAGFKPLSKEAVGKRLAVRDVEEGGALGAALASAGATATFSLSDLAFSDEEIAARNEIYPVASLIGGIAGAIPAALITLKTAGGAPAAAATVAGARGLSALGAAPLAAQAALREGGKTALRTLAAPGAGAAAKAAALTAGRGTTVQGLSALGAGAFVEGAIYGGVESATRQIKNMGIERVTDDFLAYSGETLTSSLTGGAVGVAGAGVLTAIGKSAVGLANYYSKDGKGREALARLMLGRVKDQKAKEASFELVMDYTSQVENLKDALFRYRQVEDQLRSSVGLRDDAIESLTTRRDELKLAIQEYSTGIRENKSALEALREIEQAAFDELDAAAKAEKQSFMTEVGDTTAKIANLLESSADLLGERALRKTVGKPVKGPDGETVLKEQAGKRKTRSPRVRIQEAILTQPGELAKDPVLKDNFKNAVNSFANTLETTATQAFEFVPAQVQKAVSILREASDLIGSKTKPYDEAALYDPADIIEDLTASQVSNLVNSVRKARRILNDFSYSRNNAALSQSAIDQAKFQELTADLGNLLQDPKLVGKLFAQSERQVMAGIAAKNAAADKSRGSIKAIIGQSPRRRDAKVKLSRVEKAYKDQLITPEGSEALASAEAKTLRGQVDQMIASLEVLVDDVKYLPEKQRKAVVADLAEQIYLLGQAKDKLSKSNIETLAFTAADKDLKSVTGASKPKKDVRGQKLDQALFRARLEKEAQALVNAADEIKVNKDTDAVFSNLKRQAERDAKDIEARLKDVSGTAEREATVLAASDRIPDAPSLGSRAASALKTGLEATAGAVMAGGAGAGFVAGMRRKQITDALGGLVPSVRKVDPIQALSRAATVVSIADITSKRILSSADDFVKGMSATKPATNILDSRLKRSALAKVLGSSVLRMDTQDEIPSSQDLREMIEAIDEQNRNIEETLEDMRPDDADPELVSQMQRRVASTIRYLGENKPKAASAGPLARTTPEYSLAERKRMAMISNVISDPVGTFYTNLSANTMDPKTLEVLESVYPDLAVRLQTAIMEAVTEAKESMPYSKRVMFGRLYGDYFESTIQQNKISMLQAGQGSQEAEDQGKLNAASLKQLPAAQPSAIDRVSGN